MAMLKYSFFLQFYSPLDFCYRNSAGFVYLRFDNVQSAVSAQRSLHGRWFAGKMITATFMVHILNLQFFLVIHMPIIAWWVFFLPLFPACVYSCLRTTRWSSQTATKVVSPLEHWLGENTLGAKLCIMCTLQVKGGGCFVFFRHQGYQLELLNLSSPRLHLISL